MGTWNTAEERGTGWLWTAGQRAVFPWRQVRAQPDLSRSLGIVFWAACVVAFFSFCRKASLVPRSDADTSSVLCCRDVPLCTSRSSPDYPQDEDDTVGSGYFTSHSMLRWLHPCALYQSPRSASSLVTRRPPPHHGGYPVVLISGQQQAVLSGLQRIYVETDLHSVRCRHQLCPLLGSQSQARGVPPSPSALGYHQATSRVKGAGRQCSERYVQIPLDLRWKLSAVMAGQAFTWLYWLS